MPAQPGRHGLRRLQGGARRMPGDCLRSKAEVMTEFALGLAQVRRPGDALLMHGRRSELLRYGLVVAAVVFAFGVRSALSPLLEDHAPYLFFVPALLIAAGVGGLGQGLVATGLSLPLALFFVVQHRAIGWPETVNGVAFVIIGFGAAWLGERLHQARLWAATREAHLRSILAAVPDAMIVINENGIVQGFSAAAERLFGYKAAEIIGKNVDMLMPAPHREAHNGYIKRYLATGERRMIGMIRVVAAQHRNGSTFPIELSVGEMNCGHERFFTGFIRDLTERQQTEARLQELQTELARVSRLTALGEMASAIAHELNQPLAAISNYLNGSRRLLEQLADSRLSAVRDALRNAAEQALRAGQVIRRLRDFVARKESEKRVESVTKLVQEAAALALVGAKEKGIRVAFDFDPRCDLVLADKVQIQQVLVNLMRNGIEAMEDTPRKQLMVCTKRTPDKMMMQVCVIDTGCGISDDMHAKLFEPFVTTKPSGMGVGLSISRTIVQAHGGTIEAKAGAGGGTAFRFTLPVAR
jgi:two-component system sensor kinase FixL